MTERVRDRQPSGSSSGQRSSKAERRAAAKEAAIRRAARQRRVRALLGGLAGLAVAALLLVTFVVFGRSAKDPADTASTAATASASDPAAAEGFPPLPDGADPALRTRPQVTAGKGQLSKLTVTPLVVGKGPETQAGQQITVNYVGAFYATGEEFDASWKRSEPFTFQLGAGGVIQGWDQGLVGVKVGSRVQLDIPAELGYGENPGGGRPGGPLRFVVDVLAVG
ncbi:MAG TPA: FKBP-type peptidyl-prolyl cis-trans isomerase [Micromonospora sp.]